ncbi:MAG: hypothetical protein KDE58_00930 [Caldilineaceae bacterium]|nr:hypothetical protein [Caldilineaceae bacterium]
MGAHDENDYPMKDSGKSEQNLDAANDENQALEEALTDPLYQLLVRHVLFCRLAETILTRPTPTLPQPTSYARSGVRHRGMRRP